MMTETEQNTSLDRALLEGSDEFLRLLRALNSIESPDADRRIAALAEVRELDAACEGLRQGRAVGLLKGDLASNVRLTELGAQVCDGVKQYRNWREHRHELARGLTDEMVRGKDILDVGCGVGCALITCSEHGAASLAGVDIIHSFLHLASVFARREGAVTPRLARCDGAAIPFKDDSFDLVFCRLALNYMRSDRALSEMARLARDDAWLVVCLNTLPWHLHQLWGHLRGLHWKASAFCVFTLFNGALFHAFRRQITIRHKGRMHSAHSPIYHTPSTMRRELSRWGFEPISDDADAYPLNPTFVSRRRPR